MVLPWLTTFLAEDRWESHAETRKQLTLLMIGNALVLLLIRMCFRDFRSSSFLALLVVIGILLCTLFPRVRNNKYLLYIVMALLSVYIVLSTVTITTISNQGTSLWSPQLMNVDGNVTDFMAYAPYRLFLVLCILIIVPFLSGISPRIILPIGGVMLVVCTFALVNITKYLGQNHGELVFSIPAAMLTVGLLLLYAIHIQEKMRSSVIDYVKQLRSNAEEWVEKEAELTHQKDQAISYIFHEVRNPVNAISMAAEVALNVISSGPSDCTTVKEMVENILRATDLAIVVLNDVLNMQRLQAGTFTFSSIPFGLIELHQQVVRIFQYQLTAKQIQLECHFDESLNDLEVVGDGNRLKQVIQNFLSNAGKFTPQGGCIRVEVTRISGNDEIVRVRTAVTNNGSEIAESEKPKIFRPWGQLRAGEKIGVGSGLGLALSKDFIEKGFGGIIDFTSSPDKTTFFFEIAYRIHVPEVPILEVSTVVGSPTPKSGGLTISRSEPCDASSFELPEGVSIRSVDVVVVDDSAMNRNLTLKTLQSFGVSCEAFDDGKQAVDMLTGANGQLVQCRLVLMDKEMPIMDGYAATQALRANPVFHGRIIGVTGNALDSQVSEFIEHGVDQVLTKPVKRQRIEEVLQRYGLVKSEESDSSK